MGEEGRKGWGGGREKDGGWKEGRREGRKEEREGRAGPFLGPGLGSGLSGGQEAGAGREAARGGPSPLKAAIVRSLLRETLSKKSLLVRPGLETSCSQRASEPCEMT